MTPYEDFLQACEKAWDNETDTLFNEYRGMKVKADNLFYDLERIAHVCALRIALKKSHGVQTVAAKTLGLKRCTVRHRCKLYGINPLDFKERE